MVCSLMCFATLTAQPMAGGPAQMAPLMLIRALVPCGEMVLAGKTHTHQFALGGEQTKVKSLICKS